MIITNNQPGPRGVHTTEGFVSIEAGASITADLTVAEHNSALAAGHLELEGDPVPDAEAKPAPASDDIEDLTVTELKALAEVEKVDLGTATRKLDLQTAIRAARAAHKDV